MNERKLPNVATYQAACESEEVLKFLAKTPREKERDRAQWLKLMLPVMVEAGRSGRGQDTKAVRRGPK